MYCFERNQYILKVKPQVKSPHAAKEQMRESFSVKFYIIIFISQITINKLEAHEWQSGHNKGSSGALRSLCPSSDCRRAKSVTPELYAAGIVMCVNLAPSCSRSSSRRICLT